MPRSLPLLRSLLLAALSVSAFAAPAPHEVAALVHEKDEAVLAASLQTALASAEPLVRATAARVIAIRGVRQLLPRLRDTVEGEADATAAREQIRALSFLGGPEDLSAAAHAASRWPSGMDNALALSVARRGGVPAIDAYFSTLRSTRLTNSAEFFRVALWSRPDMVPYTGSRILGAGDERGWRGLLGALTHSSVAMNGPVIASSLGSPSEDIRTASVWYLVHGYAMDPAALPEAVRAKVAEPRPELSSHREDFGLELLRRMMGGEKKNDPRWLKYLESDEADGLFGVERAALQFLTDEEYAVRYARCEVQVRECALPKKRDARATPSQPVTPAAFDLPSLLPAGLTDAILRASDCHDSWLGVANVTVDSAGRVQNLDLKNMSARPGCRRALDTLLRVSWATNTSLRSGFTGQILLARSSRASVCLDEEPPDEAMTWTFRVGGGVEAPKVLRRVEPKFPESARRALAGGGSVIVVVEAVISKSGCIRSLRLLEQSPFPELNGEALLALSQWKFVPGRLDGRPVDVQFGLTVNFKTR